MNTRDQHIRVAAVQDNATEVNQVSIASYWSNTHPPNKNPSAECYLFFKFYYTEKYILKKNSAIRQN